LGQTIGCRRANRPGPAHHHVANGPGRLAEIPRLDYEKFVWQQPLLDEQDGISLRIKSDRPKVARTATDSDVHASSVECRAASVEKGVPGSAGIPAGEVVGVETRPHGCRRYRFANSGDFDLHLLDLVLDVAEAGVLA